jgi:hypothetical protein
LIEKKKSGILARGEKSKRARGEKNKGETKPSRRRSEKQTKTNAVVLITRVVPAAKHRAAKPSVVEPRTAAQHAITIIIIIYIQIAPSLISLLLEIVWFVSIAIVPLI